VRALAFSRTRGQPLLATLASQALERLFDASAVLLLFAAAVAVSHEGVWSGQLPAWVTFSLQVGACTAAVGMLLCTSCLIWTQGCLSLVERCLRSLRGVGDSWRREMMSELEAISRGLDALRHRKLLMSIAILSLAKWCLNVALVQLSLWAAGVEAPLQASAMLAAVLAVSVAVPSSPGYVGVVQVCFVTVLKLFVDADKSVFAASVVYHAAQYVPVTVIGLVCWIQLGPSNTARLFLRTDSKSSDVARNEASSCHTGDRDAAPCSPKAT
jgi:uncharacterized protein (TIRG00374 family)